MHRPRKPASHADASATLYSPLDPPKDHHSSTTRAMRFKLGSVFVFALVVLLFYASTQRRPADQLAAPSIDKETVEDDELTEVVEPGTKVSGLEPGQRSKVIDETETLQGFSETYPTYELKDSQQDVTLAEADSIAEQVTDMVKAIPKDDLTDVVFTDKAAYDKAPYITVRAAKVMRQALWWALKPYEKYYAAHPIKAFVPHLDPRVMLTPELFHEHFRRHGAPVIISTESLRHLGFRTKKWTFDELRRAFPYNETKAMTVVADYRANGIRRDEEEIDLGPGLASIVRDEKLAKQGVLRNYPRNLHVKQEALARLQIDYPPLLPKSDMGSAKWQMPTLWLGTSSADTRFHHDCCDNFVLMVAGTKRFTLAPPTDWRLLSPLCVGANAALCWDKIPDPNSPKLLKKHKAIVDEIHKLTVELQPGEILYMPAGWFHHVKNLGPTVMVNFWTRSSQQIGLIKALKEQSLAG
jgi:hypothetical protein